jgi:hypothetical protein
MNSPVVNFLEKLSSADWGDGTDQSRLHGPPAAELYRSVQALRADVLSKGRATMTLWQAAIQNEGFRPTAEKFGALATAPVPGFERDTSLFVALMACRHWVTARPAY